MVPPGCRASPDRTLSPDGLSGSVRSAGAPRPSPKACGRPNRTLTSPADNRGETGSLRGGARGVPRRLACGATTGGGGGRRRRADWPARGLRMPRRQRGGGNPVSSRPARPGANWTPKRATGALAGRVSDVRHPGAALSWGWGVAAPRARRHTDSRPPSSLVFSKVSRFYRTGPITNNVCR